MPLTWEQVVVDSADPHAIGSWWERALGWARVGEDADSVELRAPHDGGPSLFFLRVPERKQGKNRLHLDFVPDDQEIEVARLTALGATRVDLGQGTTSWVVMADPEGNEFCVLAAR